MESADCRKLDMHAENKRHTNAYYPPQMCLNNGCFNLPLRQIPKTTTARLCVVFPSRQYVCYAAHRIETSSQLLQSAIIYTRRCLFLRIV
jgi:hypothetical protein